MPTQKAKLYINQISQTNFKTFLKQHFDIASMLSFLDSSFLNSSLLKFLSIFFSFYIYTKYIFMFNILFKSHLTRYLGTGRALKDTQRAVEYIRYLESTHRKLGHSESTRPIWQLRHLGTQTFRH